MKRNTGRIIETIILIAGILITLAVVVAIPLKSYYEHKAYRDRLIELSKPEPKPILESLSVELKEGVKYFKNDLAEPKAEDFKVVAHYTLEGEPYSEEIEPGKFKISTQNDFYSVGGDINVTYKNKTEVITIELIPVKLESITVSQNPFKVRYQTGTTFDAEGMVITAVYNDGSTKTVPTEKYVVDTTKQLALSDNAVTVSYTEGGETKTAAVSISVSDVLNDGAVVSLVLTGDAIVQSGSKLSETDMEVNAIYESGNRKRLGKEEYSISSGNTVAKLGKAYQISVTYNENPSLSFKTDVIVRSTVQAESAVIVGGTSKTETEYAVVDGVITNLNKNISFAGNFGGTVLNGGEGSITLTVTAETSVVGNITMRCGNSYCCFVNGVDKNDGYRMLPLQINTILDLTVNGKEIQIPDTVVLKGTDTHKDYAPLYGIYYEFTFENIALDPGANTIKIKFKPSTASAMTCWGESPSTLNVDYFNFDTRGADIPDDFVIEQVELSPNYTVAAGIKISKINPPVIATLANGMKVMVPTELFDIEVSGGDAGATATKYGDVYTVTATLKSNPAVTTTKEFGIEGIRILNAGVEQEGDKVYYVFSGVSYGYVAEDLTFFNESTIYDLITEIEGNKITFKIDVTLFTSCTIYPHLKVKGVNYYNGGANNNGDIRGNGIKFTVGQSVTFNGQVYKIVDAWSMPALEISQAP